MRWFLLVLLLFVVGCGSSKDATAIGESFREVAGDGAEFKVSNVRSAGKASDFLKRPAPEIAAWVPISDDRRCSTFTIETDGERRNCLAIFDDDGKVAYVVRDYKRKSP